MPWPSDVNGGKPNKEVWQTEMSGVKWWPEQGPSSDINNGVAVAGWIHSALVDGEASAWLYWWYQAYNTDDNEGLLLKSGNDTKRHYTLGNYSKFVRPGYSRVDVTGSSYASVLLSAFKGTDGTVVVVAINKGTSAVTVPITIAGGTAPAIVTPKVTSSSDNLISEDRGRGERRQLHGRARRHDRHDVRLQVAGNAPPPSVGGRQRPPRSCDLAPFS